MVGPIKNTNSQNIHVETSQEIYESIGTIIHEETSPEDL